MSDTWIAGAFFDAPEPESLDGGTTSRGHLWHSVSPRWGHSMHSMCSYHGMFPARVAHYFIERYSRVGDVVLDPFSGRGTTALQARVDGRRAICNDLNPLAYVLSRAKINPPLWESVLAFLGDLEVSYKGRRHSEPDVSQDIRMLYHDGTLKQICFVRARLLSKPLTAWSKEELMIGGALAGIMHGSWRRDDTSQYLSISMPNTFSMSPAYVEKFILENGLRKIDQDVFARLRDKLARLYVDDLSGPTGKAYHADAPLLLQGRAIRPNSVDLVLTSPPYLQVVNYGTSNWIRLWLLGIEEVGRERGTGRRQLDLVLDHRHTYRSYCEFILRTLTGIQRVMKPDGVAVVVIGDVKDPDKEKPLPLAAQVWEDISRSTNLRLMEIVEDDLPVEKKVSRIWGETKGRATSRDCALVLSRRDGNPIVESKEINWSEPYKDGGPDSAHRHLNSLRSGA